MTGLPVLKSGTLQIATLANFVPLIFQNERGQWQGFEVDLLTHIAKNLGLTLQFQVFPYEGIWTLPKKRQCDIAAAGISIMEARIKQGAAFTEPYLFIKQSLLVKQEQQEEIKNLDDLQNKTVGIVPGTTGAENALKHAPESAKIKTFANENEMLNAFERDQIDAISRGEPGNRYQAKQNRDYVITGLSGGEEQFALAVADDNPVLLNILNQQIQQLKNTKVIETIYRKWFL